MIGFWLGIMASALICVGWLGFNLSKSIHKIPVFILLLSVPIFSGILYWHFGDAKRVAQAQHAHEQMSRVTEQLQKLGSRSNVIQVLAEQVSKRPNDPKGWYLLGKLNLGGGNADEARRCLSRAFELDPKDPLIIVTLVEAEFYSADNKLSESSKKLLLQVLESDAEQVNALNLLALDAYNRHQYKTAIRYWQRCVPLFPEDSDNAKMVLSMIAQAQHHL